MKHSIHTFQQMGQVLTNMGLTVAQLRNAARLLQPVGFQPSEVVMIPAEKKMMVCSLTRDTSRMKLKCLQCPHARPHIETEECFKAICSQRIENGVKYIICAEANALDVVAASTDYQRLLKQSKEINDGDVQRDRKVDAPKGA